MKTKLALSAAVLALACLPACATSTDDAAESEEENLGTASQAWCVGPGPRPTPVVYVPGFQNPITSGTYNYGNGACNGYPVQFTNLTNTRGYMIEVHVGDSPSQSVCEHTSMTVWVWHRYSNGSWVYAGTMTDDAWWYAYANTCLHLMKFEESGPQGSYEVVVKAQARSELSSGDIGYAYNRPVKLKAFQR